MLCQMFLISGVQCPAAQVVEPMEETRTQLIMVTEAIFASSQDLLSRFEGLPGSRKPVKLSELEVKAGLLQV